MRGLMFAAAFCVLHSVGAHAGAPMASELLQMCQGRAPVPQVPELNTMLCVQYLTGYVDAVAVAAYQSRGFGICLPRTGVPNQDLINTFSYLVLKDEARLEASARVVVFQALSETYPCK